MEDQKTFFPMYLCSFNEPQVVLLDQPLEVMVNQAINFFPLIEFEIFGNKCYFGVKKCLFAIEIENPENGHVQGGTQNIECQSFNVSPQRLPEVHVSATERFALYQIVMPQPISVKASFFTHIVAHEDLDIILFSEADKPTVFVEDLGNSPFENALFKLATTTRQDYIDAINEVEEEICQKYQIIVQTINKKLPLKLLPNA